MPFDCSHGGGTAPDHGCCERARSSPPHTVVGALRNEPLGAGASATWASIDRQPDPWLSWRRRPSILENSSNDSTMKLDPRKEIDTQRFSIGAGGAGGEP
jgi:hypothetical protein